MNALVVGAYPVYATSDETAQACVAALAERDDVAGLELPWAPGLVVPSGAPGHWRHVVTCIGDAMVRMRHDPRVGLASTDDDGRRLALEALAEVRDRVVELGSVAAVEVHSAPTGAGSAEALAASLGEAAGWDWAGAELWVEHCDRWRDDQPVAKGFLSLADELEVIGRLPESVGLCVNWARSVIETRDVATGREHVALARSSGRLRGVFFSSVSDAASVYGPAWADAHLPPLGSSGAVPSSLLDEGLVRDTLAAAGDATIGLKIGMQPADQPVADKVRHLMDAVDLIARARP
ncbi:DUF4862 family protein [Aestuariimicrobium soli]|uniref:DUF4862 family protein n=1 Tax=Aestuariimicrobium soli TaxID=2035834 RepID=UPI003EB967E4